MRKVLEYLKPSEPDKPGVQMTKKDKLNALSEFPDEVEKMFRNKVEVTWDPNDTSADTLKGFEKWMRSDGVTTYIACDADHAYFIDFHEHEFIGKAIVQLRPPSIFSFFIQEEKRHRMYATHLLIAIDEFVEEKIGHALVAGRPLLSRNVNERKNAEKIWKFLSDNGFAEKIDDGHSHISYQFQRPRKM